MYCSTSSATAAASAARSASVKASAASTATTKSTSKDRLIFTTNQLIPCNCENNNNCTLQVMNKTINNMEIKKSKKDINSNKLKKTKTIEVRKEEVLAIRNRFPTKIPVIVQRFPKETYLPQLDKSKFLVPQEITMSQFQTIIRNRMHMNPNQALYLLVNNRSMLSLSLTLSEVYSEYANADGYLYVTYASQEVFGGNIK